MRERATTPTSGARNLNDCVSALYRSGSAAGKQLWARCTGREPGDDLVRDTAGDLALARPGGHSPFPYSTPHQRPGMTSVSSDSALPSFQQDTVILFGDSITQGAGVEGGIGQQLTELYSRIFDVQLRGLGGYNTEWAIHIAKKVSNALYAVLAVSPGAQSLQRRSSSDKNHRRVG